MVLFYFKKKIGRISFILQQLEEERAKQEQMSSAGESSYSNSNDTSTLGLIMEGKSIADERKVVVEVRFQGICSDKCQETGQADDSDKSSKEDDRSSSDDLDACKATLIVNRVFTKKFEFFFRMRPIVKGSLLLHT